MYAIVEMAGQQFKVAKDQKVYVHRLQAEEGKKVTFDNVLLLDDGKSITVGAPAIDGAAVEAMVVKHLKGDKVIVFKKKRRKGYKKKNGHRQALTEIIVESIIASGAKKSTPAKTAADKTPVSKSNVEKSKAATVKVEKPKSATKAKEAPQPKVEAAPATVKKAASAKKAPSKVSKADDLKKIEGVGPKAAEALIAAGVGTFAILAKTKPEKIKEILVEASSRMAHLEPTTWPQQAALAAEGKWDELKKLQDKLNGGK